MLNHLLTRFLNPDKYSGVTVTPEVTTLSLWNLSGQMVGYQSYNPSQPKVHKNSKVGPLTAKYYTYASSGQLAVWGLETVRWGDVLFLTEGVFDAARLHWHGLPAIAVISNDPKHLRNWLRMYPGVTVAAVQGDDAGRKLRKYAKRAVQLPEGEDVGSVSEDVFNELFKEYL